MVRGPAAPPPHAPRRAEPSPLHSVAAGCRLAGAPKRAMHRLGLCESGIERWALGVGGSPIQGTRPAATSLFCHESVLRPAGLTAVPHWLPTLASFLAAASRPSPRQSPRQAPQQLPATPPPPNPPSPPPPHPQPPPPTALRYHAQLSALLSTSLSTSRSTLRSTALSTQVPRPALGVPLPPQRSDAELLLYFLLDCLLRFHAQLSAFLFRPNEAMRSFRADVSPSLALGGNATHRPRGVAWPTAFSTNDFSTNDFSTSAAESAGAGAAGAAAGAVGAAAGAMGGRVVAASNFSCAAMHVRRTDKKTEVRH